MHLSSRTRAWVTVVGAVVLVLLAVLVPQLGRSGPGGPTAGSDPGPRTTAVVVDPTPVTPTVRVAPGQGSSAAPGAILPVPESALDTAARRTLALIRTGGPFPYPRNDGVTYHNANRSLPQQRDGYYREYTVPTPGSSSRGARRIIAGSGGEYYYTSDHYDSFRRVVTGT